MVDFLLRRAGSAATSVLIAVTLTFFALRVLPGDAIADVLRLSGASDSVIAQRRAQLGLDQPILVQYARTISALLGGDLGTSLVSGRPVAEMIGEQVGATVVLALGALVVATLIGLALGMLTVAGTGRPVRSLATLTTALSLASPVYWTGTLAIYLCSVQMRLLPSTGGGSNLRNLLLPWVVLGFSLAGSIARVTAASVSQNLGQDYVRVARAKGLRERVVLLRHALRPALTPIIALIALQLGFLLGGAVVTEAMFVRQGVGQLMLRAVTERDFTVVQGVVIVSTLAYSLINVAADLIVAWIDPRVRQSLLPAGT